MLNIINDSVLIMALTNEMQGKKLTSCELIKKSVPEKKQWLLIRAGKNILTTAVPAGKWELFGTLTEYSMHPDAVFTDEEILKNANIDYDRCFVLINEK